MSKIGNKIWLHFDDIKEASWLNIITFSLLYCVYITFINLVVFRQNILRPIAEATSGLIDETLIVGIISILLFGYFIIMRLGKLNISNIGLKKGKIVNAILLVLVMWAAIELLNICAQLLISKKLILYYGWNKVGASRMLGLFIDQIFGSALFEEIAFRGFLLVQICKKFRARKRSIIYGIVISQLLFSLIHIPNRIYSGFSLLEIVLSLIFISLIGILFSIIYLRTDNLFISIGIHALWNSPLLVFDGLNSITVISVMTILVLIFWDKINLRLLSVATKNSNITIK